MGLGALGSLAGAGIGFATGGPMGAFVGSGAGGALGNILSGSDEYSAPSFSDIDLQTENPELWKELVAISRQADEAERLYNQRRQGMTYEEKVGMEQGAANVAQRQAVTGQLGSAVGNSQQASAESQIRASIAERAFREQQALQQNAMAQRQAYAQALLSGQQAVLQPMQQQAQTNFQSQQAESAAQNQFFSGLFNSGMSGLAQNNNVAAMREYRAANPSPYSYGLGTPQSAGMPMYAGNGTGMWR